ncbi:MAG TPA: ribosome maturation factor RimM [Candidatus Cybelea sp.]|nr:ribosome maturation factor RimM [Candidatus Cybelea sp.]
MTEIEVGRIAGIFGLTGELKCDPTSAGRILFSAGAVLRCERENASAPIHLTQVRPHKGRLLIRIDGINDADAANAFTGAILYAPRENVPLNDDEYFDSDLVGCEVYGTDHTLYGPVERIEHYPSGDMLVVAGRLVPMVRAIVSEIDLPNRRIIIDPPAGLLD